jgi:hypothetical protein
MRRALSAVVAVMVAAAGGILLSAGPVQADDCGGNLIYRDKAMYNGTAVAELVVYYNASTGYNCARFNHLGPAYGVSAPTVLNVFKCEETSPGSGCTPIVLKGDSGDYAYYAGPVRVYAPNNCITATGSLFWHGAYRNASTDGVIGC